MSRNVRGPGRAPAWRNKWVLAVVFAGVAVVSYAGIILRIGWGG